ncbi:hypothetical protein H8356DRAFT_1332414 [Neocallimastix lanati (nom. inval.)]|nr:hypothetical protein H8356DRAFT_1332414 [Neocallimastix sp. JGI-2020a]
MESMKTYSNKIIDDNNNKNRLLDLIRINIIFVNKSSSFEGQDVHMNKGSTKYEKFMSILKINKNLEFSNRNSHNSLRNLIDRSSSPENQIKINIEKKSSRENNYENHEKNEEYIKK